MVRRGPTSVRPKNLQFSQIWPTGDLRSGHIGIIPDIFPPKLLEIVYQTDFPTCSYPQFIFVDAMAEREGVVS